MRWRVEQAGVIWVAFEIPGWAKYVPVEGQFWTHAEAIAYADEHARAGEVPC